MSILPIPTTRVSDYLVRQRLVTQTQSDQLDLFRLQNQISTGRRIFTPSEDGRAALRAITLQRSLERSDQLQINVGSAQSHLANADTALGEVATILNSISAEALGVAGTTATDEQRLTVRTNVLDVLEVLTSLANSDYQENYLFAGSQSLSAPYAYSGNYVEYTGNELSQQQWVDTGTLYETNLPGTEVFGGLSEPVLGSADLNPQLTRETLLSDLNGGQGVTAGGAIEISYVAPSSTVETESVVIDLSGARSLDDVARLIEENGPTSADLRVSVTGTGLEIETEPGATTPGSIVIREVGGNQTAAELGILAETPATTIAGDDLDPTISLTTQLSDLLGTKSEGRLSLGGSDNDLLLRATQNGASYDGLTVEIVDGATVGDESAVYDSGTNTLTVTIADGESTADEVAAAINAEGTFESEIDYRDAAAVAGAGPVSVSSPITGVTDGGSGTSLDLASGLQISNGEGPVAIDTSAAETVEDLLNILNDPENGVIAAINADGTSIDIRTRRSGADFTIGENGGTLATQLGVRTYTEETRLEDFNRGTGVLFDDQITSNEFTIEIDDAGGSTTYSIDLEGAETVQDVIDQIAADTGGVVSASLATTGNGLVLSTGLPAVASEGTYSLEGDTLTFTADTPGAAGDQSFTVEIVDSGGSGPATASVLGNAITVDLQGADSTTGDIAAAISAQLADYTVSAGSPSTTVATSASAVGAGTTDVDVTGGSDAGADTITISGDAAQRLGFFSEGADPQQVVSTTGSVSTDDRNTIEVDSVFNSLIRLAAALQAGEEAVPEIGQAIDRLDDDLDRLTAARGEIGARMNSLLTLQYRLEDEEIAMRSNLSEELDVDLTQAISDYTARQLSLEASLQTTASLLQLTILNYI